MLIINLIQIFKISIILNGFKTTTIAGSPRESGSTSNRVDESPLILRMHRGRPCNTPQRTPLSVHSMSSNLSVNSNGGSVSMDVPVTENFALHPKRATSMRVTRQRHEKISIKVSFPSSENVLEGVSNVSTTTPLHQQYAMVSTGPRYNASNGRRSSFKSSLFEIGETTFNLDATVNNKSSMQNINAIHQCQDEANTAIMVRDNKDLTSKQQQQHHSHQQQQQQQQLQHQQEQNANHQNPQQQKRHGKRSAKFQIKRFRMETKAAKTLAIIVGGFILCWLPFFTIYLIRPFCDQCIPPTVFSVLFWLGYCNSAINPVIYALFSHEFRIAFKRIVCRCVCTRSGFRASENFQMIAARALMAPATFHKTISGCSDDGDGVDFS